MATKIGAQAITMRQDTEYDNNGNDKGDLYPLTASGTGVINLAHIPNETVANIIVYEIEDDCGTPISMANASLNGKELTIAAAANKKVVVYYTYQSSDKTETYTVDATKFSGTYKLVNLCA